MNRPPNRRSYWVPNTNVFISTKGQLIIKVELSGMTSTGLEIAAEGNKLRIAGNRNDPDEEGAAQTLVAEINNGPFESELELPPEYDVTSASSHYLNGVLRIVIPRRSSAKQATDSFPE